MCDCNICETCGYCSTSAACECSPANTGFWRDGTDVTVYHPDDVYTITDHDGITVGYICVTPDTSEDDDDD